jgi:hypothetical protein
MMVSRLDSVELTPWANIMHNRAKPQCIGPHPVDEANTYIRPDTKGRRLPDFAETTSSRLGASGSERKQEQRQSSPHQKPDSLGILRKFFPQVTLIALSKAYGAI